MGLIVPALAAKNFQAWSAISATPSPFYLDAGAYGLAAHATTWGTAALQKQMPDGATLVTVNTPLAADGYQELHLTAGIYQLLLTGVTALTGEIAKLASGSS